MCKDFNQVKIRRDKRNSSLGNDDGFAQAREGRFFNRVFVKRFDENLFDDVIDAILSNVTLVNVTEEWYIFCKE